MPQTPPLHSRAPRLGPRPLPMFLGMEITSLLTCCAASQILKNGSARWNPDLPEEMRSQLGDASPAEFATAFEAESRRRFEQFLQGLDLYRNHPYRRRLRDAPVIWQAGGVTLRSYGGPETGLPILAIPSLVNRAYVLDLNGRRSFMRWLARRGFRPFLIDWGDPQEERAFSLGDYVLHRLEPAAAEVLRLTGQKPAVIGYCMGGVLTLALAQRRPDLCAAYIGLATPWNFHAGSGGGLRLLLETREKVAEAVEHLGFLPVDILQAMFSGLDPGSIARKFRMFAGLGQTSDKAKAFVALEDWVNDGVPLAGPAAQECLLHWYGENRTFRQEWTVAGETVRPGTLTVPSLTVVPLNDRIVPPGSAIALSDALTGSPGGTTRLDVPLGHIGMMTGSAAVRTVYGPLARWLRRACAETRS